MNRQRVVRSLAVAALLYAVATLNYVSSCPDVRLRCLLADGKDERGLQISATPGLEDKYLPTPQPGDMLTGLGRRRVDNFLQFAQALVSCRGAKLDAGAILRDSADPLELPADSSLSYVEWRGSLRVRVTYTSMTDAGPQRETSWLRLQSLPPGRMTFTLAWLAVQVGLFLFAAVVHWRRPKDSAAAVFLALCSVTLVSLVGGSYWWIVATSPWLAVPFLTASTILPACLAHFFLTFPRPSPAIESGRGWLVGLLYLPAIIGAVALIACASVAWGLTPIEEPSGAWADYLEAFRGSVGDVTMTTLRLIVYIYAGVATLYVVLGLGVLVAASRRAGLESERRQSRYMLAAGFASCILIGYVLWLAIVDQSRLALGEAQAALYGTSLLIAAAYTVGLLQARPTLLDEAAEQGFRYTLLRSGTTLLFSVAVALASLVAVSRNLPWYGSPLLTTITLTIAVLLAWWSRERVQGAIDRRFYRERFRLDRAVQRIYQAADESLEPDILGEQTLRSCRDALGVQEGAMYLRRGDVFHVTVRDASWSGPHELRPAERAMTRFSEGTLLQRAPGMQNEVQALLRQAGAEAIQPVTGRQGVIGLILLGRRQDGQGFSAEDATFLAALGPMTGVAMESARIHGNIARLDEELRQRIGRIEDQEREIRLLESELAEYRSRDEVKPALLKAASDDDVAVPSATHVRGSSLIIREVLATARKVAGSDASVLIRGESGTGKELLARTIHEASPRADGPLVTLHCAALSSSLLESELFGHVKGAFTDARSDRTGRFEQANGGTLFLDEVGDIPPDVQVKLLRVLQERVVERVGSTESRAVDVRLVAATHQDLDALIEQGRFREDLLYRLNVVELRLPALRERGDDVIELAEQFLSAAAEKGGYSAERFSQEARDALRSFHWPGNVRQLQNVISRAVVLSEGPVVGLADLPDEIRSEPRRTTLVDVPPRRSLVLSGESLGATESVSRVLDVEPIGGSVRDAERDELIAALDAADGNKAAAARKLGMPRSTFFSKLKKHGIATPRKPR